jgi:O-antigen/teichoic acid export membrane protein
LAKRPRHTAINVVPIRPTVFKIFRSATLIYAAGLDPLMPRQTRAFAEHDAATLKKATLTATTLCAIPTLALCALLLFAGDRVFAVPFGQAASVPSAATLLLSGLLLANLAQNVATCLLLQTGFFREIARVANVLVVAMAMMTAVVLVIDASVIGFIGDYTLVYVGGAASYVAYVVRKPFRIGSMQKAAP